MTERQCFDRLTADGLPGGAEQVTGELLEWTTTYVILHNAEIQPWCSLMKCSDLNQRLVTKVKIYVIYKLWKGPLATGLIYVV